MTKGFNWNRIKEMALEEGDFTSFLKEDVVRAEVQHVLGSEAQLWGGMWAAGEGGFKAQCAWLLSTRGLL